MGLFWVVFECALAAGNLAIYFFGGHWWANAFIAGACVAAGSFAAFDWSKGCP